jgi:hypothetical protein
MFEPFFNGALLAYKLGDFQESFDLATKALAICPDHHDSLELVKQLKNRVPQPEPASLLALPCERPARHCSSEPPTPTLADFSML